MDRACLIFPLVSRKKCQKAETNQNCLYIHQELYFILQAGVFYMMYNTIFRFEDSGHYYCYCDKIPGCEGTYGFRGNCTVCLVTRFYCFNELNQNKNNPLKLLQYAETLFEDLQEICDYAETISELWLAN